MLNWETFSYYGQNGNHDNWKDGSTRRLTILFTKSNHCFIYPTPMDLNKGLNTWSTNNTLTKGKLFCWEKLPLTKLFLMYVQISV